MFTVRIMDRPIGGISQLVALRVYNVWEYYAREPGTLDLKDEEGNVITIMPGKYFVEITKSE